MSRLTPANQASAVAIADVACRCDVETHSLQVPDQRGTWWLTDEDGGDRCQFISQASRTLRIAIGYLIDRDLAQIQVIDGHIAVRIFVDQIADL